MAITKIERELKKKQKRRQEESQLLEEISIQQHQPIDLKRPDEYKLKKNDPDTFELPIAIGNTIIEKKNDGNLVGISIDHNTEHEPIQIYSSNSNKWNPDCFPEVTRFLHKIPSGYYQAEIRGKQPAGLERFTNLDEFEAFESRPTGSTKNLTPEMIEQQPLMLDIFDCLMVEGKSLLNQPFWKRRQLLEQKVDSYENLAPVKQWNITDKESLHKLYLWGIDELEYEGFIAKDPESLYIPGSRNSDWIKLKEFFTIDLAVIGIYETESSRKKGQPFSGLLCATYNSETKKFETMRKLSLTGKANQDQIYPSIQQYLMPTDQNYENLLRANEIEFNPKIAKEAAKKRPDHMVIYPPGKDLVIVEAKALNVTYKNNYHSCGLSYGDGKAHSLREASFKRVRTDKTRREDVTTTQQIHAYFLGETSQ